MGQIPGRQRVTRGGFLALGGTVAGGALLSACGGSDSGGSSASTTAAAPAASSTAPAAPAHPPIDQEPGKLFVFDYAGYDTKDLWTGYANRFPSDPPRWKFLASDTDAYAQVRAGFKADLVHPCVGFFQNWVDADAIEPFDTSLLQNFANLNPALVKAGEFNGKQYVIPSDWGFISALYRSDKVDPGEPSWNLLFDKRYKGKITWYDNPADMLFIGGFAIGADNPFQMTDEELDAVKAKFLEAKPGVRSLWSAESDMINDFKNDNAWISYAWPSAWLATKDAGLKVEYLQPAEGRLAFLCGFSMFKGTKNYRHAHEYVDAWTSPESGEWLLNNFGYGHSNTKLDLTKVKPELVDAFQLRDPASIAEPAVHLLRYNPVQAKYDKVWAEIKAA